jgi:hypothetical protein
MRIRLTIISGPDGVDDAANGIDFYEAGGLIGRSLACDWVLDRSDSVSRWHARVLFAGGDFHILDTSLNGVYLNDSEERIGRDRQARLRDGDRIRIGDYLIRVEIEDDVATSAPASPDAARLPASSDEFSAEPASADSPEQVPSPAPPEEPADAQELWDDADDQEPAADRSGSFNKVLQKTENKVPRVDIDYSVDGEPRETLDPAQIQQAKEAYHSAASHYRGESVVDFAVFGPRRLEPDKWAMIDVWAYPNGEFARVKTLAAELGREHAHGRKSGVSLRRGAAVMVELSVRGAKVMTPVDRLVWDGVATNVSFAVLVPGDCEQDSLVGAAVLSIDGIPIGNVVFTIEVSGTADPSSSDYDHRWLPMRSAFASYTYEDRAEVFARLQGILTVAPDIEIFMDVLSLRAGDDWGSRLLKEVASKDRFLLFWSRAAAASDWVEREWRFALNRRGLPYIRPVPLQDPKDAPPPQALSGLHFNDAFLAHIAYQRDRQARRDRSD